MWSSVEGAAVVSSCLHDDEEKFLHFTFWLSLSTVAES